MMLYLLDANVLITAHNKYYPVDRVPEFWEWLQHQGKQNNVKIPLEVMEEIKVGNKDLLLDWINASDVLDALLLKEDVDPSLVQRVVGDGYAIDLTDVEIEQLGRDPFLIAYAQAKSDRCVVTVEVSRPTRQRQNRHIPDVCNTLRLPWCDPFKLNRELGFRTAWRATR